MKNASKIHGEGCCGSKDYHETYRYRQVYKRPCCSHATRVELSALRRFRCDRQPARFFSCVLRRILACRAAVALRDGLCHCQRDIHSSKLCSQRCNHLSPPTWASPPLAGALRPISRDLSSRNPASIGPLVLAAPAGPSRNFRASNGPCPRHRLQFCLSPYLYLSGYRAEQEKLDGLSQSPEAQEQQRKSW